MNCNSAMKSKYTLLTYACHIRISVYLLWVLFVNCQLSIIKLDDDGFAQIPDSCMATA